MLTEFVKNGIPGWVLVALAAGLFIYAAAAVWTHLSVGRLLWQNLFRSNRVELPRLGRELPVLPAGTASQERMALVLSRANLPLDPDKPAARNHINMIYPVAGRNGLHFTPELCTSCGLCVYSCPTGAVSTLEVTGGYQRSFDLSTCVYCGLCESACPTGAIRLTFNQQPAVLEDSIRQVEGKVEATACYACGRIVPSPDLLADRIYAGADDLNHTNPDGICQECRSRVLEAEEVICG